MSKGKVTVNENTPYPSVAEQHKTARFFNYFHVSLFLPPPPKVKEVLFSPLPVINDDKALILSSAMHMCRNWILVPLMV